MDFWVHNQFIFRPRKNIDDGCFAIANGKNTKLVPYLVLTRNLNFRRRDVKRPTTEEDSLWRDRGWAIYHTSRGLSFPHHSVIVGLVEAARPRAPRRIGVGGRVHRVDPVGRRPRPRLPPLGLPAVPLVLLAAPLLLADAALLDLPVLVAVVLVALL